VCPRYKLFPTPGRFSIVLGFDGFTHLLQFHPAISARDTPTAETAVEAPVVVALKADISPAVAIEVKITTALALLHCLLLRGFSVGTISERGFFYSPT